MIDAGQAAIELALALPIVAVIALGLVQVALVARDQLALELAAREAARAASVSADPDGAARTAADGAITLRPLDVTVAVSDGRVTVTVSSHRPTDVPLIGSAIAAVELRAAATMALEPP